MNDSMLKEIAVLDVLLYSIGLLCPEQSNFHPLFCLILLLQIWLLVVVLFTWIYYFFLEIEVDVKVIKTPLHVTA